MSLVSLVKNIFRDKAPISMEQQLKDRYWGHITDPRLMSEDNLPDRPYKAYKHLTDSMIRGREGLVFQYQYQLMKLRYYIPQTLTEAQAIVDKFSGARFKR